MSNTSRLECRFCGSFKTLAILKKDHGPTAPICRAIRDDQRMRSQDLRLAGQFGRVLEAAGLTTQGLFHVWQWEKIPDDEVVWKTDDEGHTRADAMYRRLDFLSFELVVPTWAHTLAKRLTQDHDLARALGYTQKKMRRTITTVVGKKNGAKAQMIVPTKEWVACDKSKALPFSVRVKILRVAGTNALAREMINDDPHAAGIIIRDAF